VSAHSAHLSRFTVIGLGSTRSTVNPAAANIAPRPPGAPDRLVGSMRGRSGTARASSINLRPVPGVGAEIVLRVDGEWRQTRPFACASRRNSRAIADTQAMFEAKGGRDSARRQKDIETVMIAASISAG
jgi:hypothetical protein